VKGAKCEKLEESLAIRLAQLHFKNCAGTNEVMKEDAKIKAKYCTL
jgi:hypothetical protein